jgi:ABC-2 type transport system permease protein
VTEAWLVARQEIRDLWLGGRALPLMLAYSVMLSVTTYLVASNRALNFLEQREAVSLTVQVAVSVSALLVVITAADAVTGERERGTLEVLLVTPVPRWSLVAGKMISAMTLWLASYVVSVPYIWYLGRGTGVLSKALTAGFVIGLVLALFLCGLGMTISTIVRTNRIALAVSLFVLLAVFIPTQLPVSTQNGSFADILLRADPITAGLHYLSQLLVQNAAFGNDFGWLTSPFVLGSALVVAALVIGNRIKLIPGTRA